jgi:hypothetical protein
MPSNRIVAIVGGAVLFIFGLIIGAAISGGPSVEEIDAAVAKRIEAANAAQTAELGKIEASVSQLAGDLGGRLDGIAGSVESGAKSVSDVGDRIGSDVEALGQSLHSAVAESSASQLAALESGLAGLRGQISAAPADEPASAAPAAEAPASAAAAPTDGFSPGETAVLSDGALRVFVSRLDEAGGTAHLRANGQDVAVGVGQSAMVASEGGDCRVTLDALGGGKAAVSGACGDALPEPDGAAPGTTVDLADGLRVFVSGVTDGGARIAVNGVNTVTLPVGDSVEATVDGKSCSVSVEGIDRGRVALGYVCS